jgi:DNA-binding transcriptional MerR regulator
MAFYKIRDVEILTGIKAHTLRIWEQRYGVLVPERTETKIRTYTDEELVYLLNIRMLIDHGMKISRLSEFSPTEIRAKVAEIKLKTPAGSAQEKLIVSLVEMDEALFHGTLNELINATSLEETFLQCLIPFFDRIGIMWLSGSINPAQEHFISNLVRQKIVSEVDKLKVPEDRENPVMLYLPEHEWHEIGLLFYHYLLRSQGVYSLYLGQSLPYESVVLSIEKVQPRCVISSWLTSVEEGFIRGYFSQLRRQFPELLIIAGGAQLGIHHASINNLVTPLQHAEDLIKLIKSPHLQSSPVQQ